MSVKIGYESKQGHPFQGLLRNIIERLDSLQGYQMKPYLKTKFLSNDREKQVQKLEQNMKIIVESNLQNLRMLEENMRQNIEQLYQKVKKFQNKIIHTLKQNQQAMQYLQYRVVSVENSQKNVTQFMKRVSQHQNDKYSGVNILEQRIKQIEHLFEVKNQKTNDAIKIVQQETSMETNRFIRELQQKIQKNTKQISLNQTKLKNDDNVAAKQEIEQLRSKLKRFQVELKQQKNKNTHLEQICNQSEQNVSNVIKKLENFQKQFKSNEPSEKNIKHQTLHPKFNTQTYQNDINSQKNKNNTYSKNTQPSHKKPSIPKISQQNKANAYEILGRKQSRRQASEVDSEDRLQSQKKIRIHHGQESDQDPFENMVGGIRGLLKKSKQKQMKNDSSKKKLNQNIPDPKKPLPRQQKLAQLNYQKPKNHLMNKNLPPVKADIKKQNKVSYVNSEQNQDGEVYQVDEDGYLVDEQGNYLYDQDGNRVQIQEDMYDLIEQRR